jgi:predicted acylesterase/phospholipase RssA
VSPPARLALAACAALTLSACTSLIAPVPRLPVVPRDLRDDAVVVDAKAVRYRSIDSSSLRSDLQDTIRRERADLGLSDEGVLPPTAFLAISGGGQNGAFSAGLLTGWTARGDRPEFKVVTGISTGALIAPFAFLGPAWDDTLARLYTTHSTQDILTTRGFTAALRDDALADNLPLKQLVEANITPAVVAALARESRRGRTLLVGTTDLDAGVPVLWNLTRMAESPDAATLDLIRQVLVASAAIPGQLPPVMIDVEAGGRRYQEMHVDGGTTQQVFVLPSDLLVSDFAPRERTIYVIRNSRTDIAPESVDRGTLAIARRAIGTLIHTQGIGNLYEIAERARRDGAGLRITFIPGSFAHASSDEFDRDYMNDLFALGYSIGRAGVPWATSPPAQ